MLHLVLAFALFVSVLGISSQSVKASVWNNAYTYYSTYGNSVVFRPMTSTDGMIYYATKAKKASTSTVYRTLGWKVSIKNMSGSTLQTLYFKLGGSYMYVTDTVTKNNYEYNLFSLSLYKLTDGRMLRLQECDIDVQTIGVMSQQGCMLESEDDVTDYETRLQNAKSIYECIGL